MKIKIFNKEAVLGWPVIALVVVMIAFFLFLVDWGFINNSYTVYQVYEVFGRHIYVRMPATYFVDKANKSVRTNYDGLVNDSTCNVVDRKNFTCVYSKTKDSEPTFKIFMKDGYRSYYFADSGIGTLCCVNMGETKQVTKIEWLYYVITTPIRYLVKQFELVMITIRHL